MVVKIEDLQLWRFAAVREVCCSYGRMLQLCNLPLVITKVRWNCEVRVMKMQNN